MAVDFCKAHESMVAGKGALLGLASAAFAASLAGCASAPEPEPAPAPVVVMPAPVPSPVIIATPPPLPEPVVVSPPTDPFGTILAGVIDLPRSPETAAIDGCTKVHKGLTISGGFLFFTCEKLMPGIDISRQAAVARDYADQLEMRGWQRGYNAKKKQDEFVQYDSYGCKMTVSVTPWTDRAMNEPRAARSDREAFRQIVFLTHFAKGAECEPTYQAFRSGALLR